MPASAHTARHGAFAASLRRFPRGLVHPVVLTFLVAAYFSYVSADAVRAVYLLAVGLAYQKETGFHLRRPPLEKLKKE